MPVKYLLIFLLVFVFSQSYGQAKESKLHTIKYAGFYSYGTSAEKGRIGIVTVYPETDSTILFYIELNKGPTDYNMGSVNGRLQVVNDTGVFYLNLGYNPNTGCKLIFKFEPGQLLIHTVDGQDDCGFGAFVYADGNFKRKSHKIIDNYINMEGDTVYFKSLKF